MAISVECTSCKRRFRAKDEFKGKQTTCPKCGQTLVIDGPHVRDHDVFISYSVKDKPVAEAICAALEADRIRCWIAPRDIPVGLTWPAAIIEAIEESRAMIVVFSGHSNASQQVLREVERAVAKGVAIFPLRIEDVAMSKDMEYLLSASHWMDALTPPLEEHLRDLAGPVRLLLLSQEKRAQGSTVGQAAPAGAGGSVPAPLWRRPGARWLAAGLAAAMLWVAAVVAATHLASPNRPAPGQSGLAKAAQAVSDKRPPESAKQPATTPMVVTPAKSPALTLDLGNNATMKLVLIPAGKFIMGEEKDLHEVTLSKPLYMGVTEVTQAQYQAIMGTNPSKFKGETNPVETVSWNDATEFCKKLSEKTRRAVRLPTEAEWEYACRAGSRTRFCFGDAEQGLGDYAAIRDQKTHPVGQKKPNAWGLYDMHGNVWEWCADWYGDYPKGAATDPQGAASGSQRVLRGGSWNSDPGDCRAALRDRLYPGNRYYDFGFRVVVSLAGVDLK